MNPNTEQITEVSLVDKICHLELYDFHLYYDEKLNLWQIIGEDSGGELYLRSSTDKEYLINEAYSYIFS